MTVLGRLMTRAATSSGSSSIEAFRLPRLLSTGLWLGLVTGIAEGVLFLLLQSTGLTSWITLMVPVDRNILWAALFVDTALFVLAAGVMWPALRLLPESLRFRAATTLLTALTFYALISISGRVYEPAAVLLALGLGSALSRRLEKIQGVWLMFVGRTLPSLALLGVLVGITGLSADRLEEVLERARQAPAAEPSRPSVLLIVLDTLRADRLGAYGYERETTPFLDRYARLAVRYDSAFATAPWTVASHASMFTGLYPYQHGAERYALSQTHTTLAEVLAENGYATAAVVANGKVLTRAFGLAQGFQHWDNLFTTPQDTFVRTTLGRRVVQYAGIGSFLTFWQSPVFMEAADVNRHALDWLDSRPGRPFFLFLNYMEMHSPCRPSREYAERFTDDAASISRGPLLKVLDRQDSVGGVEYRRRQSDAYDACLATLDAELADLFNELGQRRLDDDLLVIITSDHGESLGEHGLYEHFTSVYLEQVRVPLMIRLPGRTADGTVVSAPVSLAAIPETVIDLVGLNAEHFPMASLSQFWSPDAPQDAEVFSEVASNEGFPDAAGLPNGDGWVKSVTTRDWHFILNETGRKQLYRWRLDTEETQDLVNDPELQDRVRYFEGRLLALAEARPEAAADE